MIHTKNKKIKKTFHILLVFVVSIIFTFFSLEIILRCSENFRLHKERVEWLRSIMMYDPILGWKHVPNSQACSKSSEYEVCYKINSKSFRDKEHSYSRDKSYRILCLGDSITFGWGVDTQDRFSNILEKKLSDVEVLNMGVQGYGIDQELLLLKSEAVKYHPDMVLIYIIPHNLERACHSKMWDRPKAKFILEDNKLVLSNTPVPRVDMFSFNTPIYDWIRYRLSKISYAFYFLHDCLYLLRERNFEDTSDKKIKLKLAKAIFKQMQGIANIHNFKLILVGEFSEDMMTYLDENYISVCKNPLFYCGNDAGKLYFKEYDHPNNLGNKVLANGIYTYLLNDKLIPGNNLDKNIQ